MPRQGLYREVRRAARFAGRARLQPLLRRWTRSRPGLIFVIHDTRAEVLAEQLRALATMHELVSLDDIVGRVADGRSTSGLAAVTLDDGFAPVVEAGARLAADHGWPMTFFLPTAAIGASEPAWYQELPLLVARARVAEATVPGHRLRLDGDDARRESRRVLNQRFLELTSTAAVDELLRSVRRALLGTDERPEDLAWQPTVTWEKVAELARRDELRFEAHSVNHLPLGRLPAEQIAEEMDLSRARVEEATGRRVRHFCYPFGSDAEVGTLAPVLARERFASAVTTARGRCGPGDDPWLLPRIPLLEHESADEVVFKATFALALAR